jgi:hypothetical protein
MQRGMRVRNEGNPDRCEICHQSDCLDPETLECSRCCDLDIPLPLLTTQSDKEEMTGLIIPFRQSPLTGIVSVILAVALSVNIVGPVGLIFLVGLAIAAVGIRRVFADSSITNYPTIDLLLNLAIMSAGLAGCFYSGLYLLRLIGAVK